MNLKMFNSREPIMAYEVTDTIRKYGKVMNFMSYSMISLERILIGEIRKREKVF